MGKTSEKKKMSITGSPEALPPSFRLNEEGSKHDTDSKTRLCLMLLVILFVSCGVYFNTLWNGFVYDDNDQVLNNPWIKNAEHIPDIFSKSVWNFLGESLITNYYRPLMHVGYMLSYYLFGLNPWGFHLVNILFHAGVTILVFLITSRLLRDARPLTPSPYLSAPFLAALLFASHPIHTEAVSWIAGLPEVSFTFFSLLSFYLYLRSTEGSKGKYLLSVASFSLAVFFKETALTLPLVLIAYDHVFGKARHHVLERFRKYIPYFFVAGVYLIARIHALGGIAPQKRHIDLTTYHYFINIFPLFVRYVEKLLLPVNLNAFHVFYPIGSIFETKGILSLTITMVLAILGYVAWGKNRMVFFSLLLVLIPLLPVFYIPGLGENVFAERYLYLPSVGFVFLFALLISSARIKASRWTVGFTAISIALIGAYAIGTVQRNVIWKDNYSLFADTVKKSPDSAIPHLNLGIGYYSQGLLDKAIEQYQIALRLKPDYAEAHNNLGNAYLVQGLTDKAIEQYRITVSLKPDNAVAHLNLGNAYLAQGFTDKAIEQYQMTVSLKPDNAGAYNNLGTAYAYKGLSYKAIEQYRIALRLNPGYAKTHYDRGLDYEKKGLIDKAIEEYQIAILAPGFAQPHNNLGVLYAKKGLIDEAIEHFQTALRVQPNYAIAHYNLGVAYGEKSLVDKAIEEYETALRLDLNSASVHDDLGRAFFNKGRVDKAIEQYELALRLNAKDANVHSHLGRAYEKKGLIDQAIEHFKTAVKLDPDSRSFRNDLAQAYKFKSTHTEGK